MFLWLVIQIDQRLDTPVYSHHANHNAAMVLVLILLPLSVVKSWIASLLYFAF